MATLKAVFSSLFPDSPNIENLFSRPPLMPTDIFAFVGHLLERSGAYDRIAPEVPDESDSAYRRIVVDEAVRKEAARITEALDQDGLARSWCPHHRNAHGRPPPGSACQRPLRVDSHRRVSVGNLPFVAPALSRPERRVSGAMSISGIGASSPLVSFA
jgi:hypothetical protein